MVDFFPASLRRFNNHGQIILILIIAAVLRFYRFPEMVTFDFDQEYASNFAYSVIKEFPIQMVGQGLSVQGLFMGPWYFYYLVPFFWLFNLSPIGGYVGSIVLGLITIWVYYAVIGKVFNRRIGLIAALIRAVSFSGIGIDWAMTPALSSDLMVIITWYLFYRYWHNDTKRFWPLIALCFGLYSSFHPILFPFYGVFIILILIKKRIPRPKQAIVSAFTLLLPLLPLIAFEYFRKLTEVKKLLSMFGGDGSSINLFDFNEWLNHLTIIATSYNFGFDNPTASQSISIIITSLIVGLVIYLTLKKQSFFKSKFHLTIIILTPLVFLLYYHLLQTHVTEYYFNAPVVILNLYLTVLLGILFNYKFGRIVVILLLLLFCLSNGRRLRLMWANTSKSTFYYKDAIIKEILKSQPSDKPFFVSYIKRPGWNFGFDYLFKYYQRLPFDKPIIGSIFTIVIPREMAPGNLTFTSGNIGLIIEK